MPSSYELLGENGPFATLLDGFSPRPEQREMAQAVEAAIDRADKLVIEAGTGVGKTFAYLAASLLAGRKVIISTGTKHLQDQLYHKDLPVMRKAVNIPVTTALLKGRANYLCLHRLNNTLQQDIPDSNDAAAELVYIRDWSKHTQSGDIAELSAVSEESSFWPRVTSTTENCLGQECADYQQCHVVKARRAAQEADVVVINHHLFFADLVLKEEGFGELLPSANAFILDEAHQLPEIASNFFGTNLSSRQLMELSHDCVAEQLRDAPDAGSIRSQTSALDKAVMDLRLDLGRGEQRGAWQPVLRSQQVAQALGQVRDCLQLLIDELDTLADRGKGLKQCQQRAQSIMARLELMEGEPDNAVQWYETFRRSFVLHSTPLEVGSIFKNHMESYPCAWVFTSATLAIRNRFDHFITSLGLEGAECRKLDSPYDYKTNALLYMPPALPEPASNQYTAKLIDKVLPVLEASGGRAFLLFTSHRALREAAEILSDRSSYSLPYPLLVQGDAPRRELLERFREAGNAVLLGTSSFWEGVDVRGEALSLVVIDKLPFASPGDPVLQARLEALSARGGNPFMEIQLPHAVITLKQGVGRLIRHEHDRGVLMLCDPRIHSKAYGSVFIKSLPEMPITRDVADVEHFFLHDQQASEAISS